jgi:hypothetical protein
MYVKIVYANTFNIDPKPNVLWYELTKYVINVRSINTNDYA